MADLPRESVSLRPPAGGAMRHRVEDLLDRDDAARAVAALPSQELYALVAEIGLDSQEGQELIGYATPAQIRGCLDLDGWLAQAEGELPDVARMIDWLGAVAAAGPDRLARAVAGLDEELASYLALRLFRIYDPQLDEVPEHDQPITETPDRLFLLEPLAEGPLASEASRLIDLLYRGDQALARAILLSARAALPSALEEEALQFRRGRLADLGFPDPIEALEVYAYLDPARLRLDEGTADHLARSDEGRAAEQHALALVLAPELEGGLLAETLRRIPDETERERLRLALLFLMNRVLVADRAALGDRAAMDRVARRVAANVGLGLEAVCRADLTAAPKALANIALVRLFRAGVSFGTKLRRLIEALSRAGLLSPFPSPRHGIAPPTLLADEDRALVEALARRPPELPSGEGQTRPFSSAIEVRQATTRIEAIGLDAALVWQGLDADRAELLALGNGLSPPLHELRFSHLVLAAAVRALAGSPIAARPVTPRELVLAAERARSAGADAAIREAGDALTACATARGLPAETSRRRIDLFLLALPAALRGAREPLDLREITAIAVRRG